MPAGRMTTATYPGRPAQTQRITLALFLFGASMLAALLARADDAPSPARARVLEPTPIADELYTESFTAVADLSDGTYVTVQLGISNAGPGDGHGACRVVLAEKGQQAWSKDQLVDRDGWSFAATPAPTFSIGKCKMTSGSKLDVSASIEGATIELSLAADAEKLREPAIAAKNSDDFYDLEMLIPWARATATIARPGASPRKLTGWGNADHSRATALPKKTAKRWVRFFGFEDKGTRLVLVREPGSGVDRDGWTWADDGRGRVPITRLAIVPTGKGTTASWRVMLDGAGGPWRITTQELLHRDAPLEDHGWIGSVLGTVVGNPVTYTYRAKLASKQDRRELEGIFEIAISSE